MRKSFVIAVTLGLLALVSTESQAAEKVTGQTGQISTAELEQFGLGGMEVVSDEEGQQIRGKGFGSVFYSLRNKISSIVSQKSYYLRRIAYRLKGHNSRR